MRFAYFFLCLRYIAVNIAKGQFRDVPAGFGVRGGRTLVQEVELCQRSIHARESCLDDDSPGILSV